MGLLHRVRSRGRQDPARVNLKHDKFDSYTYEAIDRKKSKYDPMRGEFIELEDPEDTDVQEAAIDKCSHEELIAKAVAKRDINYEAVERAQMRAALSAQDGDAPAKDHFNLVDEELYKACFPQMFSGNSADATTEAAQTAVEKGE